jgi:hypothetical protein
MGYYWRLEETSVIIPENEKVLQLLKDINTTHHLLKKGGSYDGKKWFSWMPEDYDETCTSVKEIFELLGFECETIEDEDDETIRKVQLISFDNKRGQEMLFLALIAHFIEDGSYMKFRAEDELIFEYTFQLGKLYEVVYDPTDENETFDDKKKEIYKGGIYSNYKYYQIDLYSKKTPMEQFQELLKKTY